ncbi:MAG: hypothetical protein NWQ53_08565 [Flavobacteriales bacterium]|nr:hypothetical protein [Flavobacteriales bacterium]
MENRNKVVLILESNPAVSTLYMNIIRSLNSKIELIAYESAKDFQIHSALISPTIVYLAEDFCSEMLGLIHEIQASYRKAEIFVLSHSQNLKMKDLGVKSLYQPFFVDAFSRHFAF